jgi:hypothetical protein
MFVFLGSVCILKKKNKAGKCLHMGGSKQEEGLFMKSKGDSVFLTSKIALGNLCFMYVL